VTGEKSFDLAQGASHSWDSVREEIDKVSTRLRVLSPNPNPESKTF